MGFEPTERVNVRQFSRLLQSTALALLQKLLLDMFLFYYIKIFCQDTKKKLFLLAKNIFTLFLKSMKIQNKQQNNNFKGYDARKLKGFIMNSNFAGIADEMRKIGEIENFKVFLFEHGPKQFILKNDSFEITPHSKGCWAQDCWGIVKNSLLSLDNLDKTQILKKTFKLQSNKLQEFAQEMLNINKLQEYVDILYNLPVVEKNGKKYVQIVTENGIEHIDKNIFNMEFNRNVKILEKARNQTHVKGGNYFLTKNQNGEDELLIGENELKKFSREELQQMFKVKNIFPIPLADFHIDLFIRPLKDKKVLIADDNMMLDILAEGAEKIKNAAMQAPKDQREQFRTPLAQTNLYLQQFKEIINQNPYAKMQDVEKALIDAGYEPIKVPARVFEIYGNKGTPNSFYLKQLHNYMNANVLINDKNEVIYITNKSNLDETLGLTKEIKDNIGFSLENEFIKHIKPHVDKIYFVSGENNAIPKTLLPIQNGGIHCMCAEIPK